LTKTYISCKVKIMVRRSLPTIAHRIANKMSGVKPPVRTSSRLPVQLSPVDQTVPVVTEREMSECKSETIVRKNNLSQAEFIASQRADGEPDMIDFVDVLMYTEVKDNDITPEELMTLIPDVMDS